MPITAAAAARLLAWKWTLDSENPLDLHSLGVWKKGTGVSRVDSPIPHDSFKYSTRKRQNYLRPMWSRWCFCYTGHKYTNWRTAGQLQLFFHFVVSSGQDLMILEDRLQPNTSRDVLEVNQTFLLYMPVKSSCLFPGICTSWMSPPLRTASL